MIPATHSPVDRIESIGDLLNHIIPALECAGLEPEPGSVSEDGLVVMLAGRPVRIAFIADLDVDARRVPRAAAIFPPELDDVFGDDIPFMVSAAG